MIVLGIDPGGRNTGLVLVDGDVPVDGTVARCVTWPSTRTRELC